MKTIQVSTEETYRATVSFEDGEVRSQPYTRTGRTYRASVAVMTWTSRDAEPFALSSTEVHGSVLKKDGTEGQNGASERFYRSADCPDWLTDLIAAHAPADRSTP